MPDERIDGGVVQAEASPRVAHARAPATGRVQHPLELQLLGIDEPNVRDEAQDFVGTQAAARDDAAEVADAGEKGEILGPRPGLRAAFLVEEELG